MDVGRLLLAGQLCSGNGWMAEGRLVLTGLVWSAGTKMLLAGQLWSTAGWMAGGRLLLAEQW